MCEMVQERCLTRFIAHHEWYVNMSAPDFSDEEEVELFTWFQPEAQKLLRGKWQEVYFQSQEAATAQLGTLWPWSPQDPSLCVRSSR